MGSETKAAERTREQGRAALRRKVRMFYDLQRLRIASGGRSKPKGEGIEVELHEVDLAILDARSGELGTLERNAMKDIQDHLASLPFYRDVLSDKSRFKGMGPTLAAVILSEFDIHRTENASQLWSYAGLAPVAATRCRHCHVLMKAADVEAHWTHTVHKHKCDRKVLTAADVYESAKAMKPTAGEKLPYNSWLRTKLVGVLGPCLLKSGSPWRKFYDDYKLRKQSAGWGTSDGHRHNAAIRYMVKMLLLEVWREWRLAEGLSVRDSYQADKLGHVHGGAARAAAGG